MSVKYPVTTNRYVGAVNLDVFAPLSSLLLDVLLLDVLALRGPNLIPNKGVDGHEELFV